MGDSAEQIARDVAAIGRIEAVPKLLRVLCETTGMGFAAVARVTDGTWTACAVDDGIDFGLKPGGQLELATTLCTEVRASRAPVVISKASDDPVYAKHHTPRIYGIESYVSVPIILANGDYFGNLCAIDPRPAKVSEPRIVSMFTLFAQLIAMHLDNDRKREQAQSALLDERTAGELREQFIAILGHDLRNPLAAVSAGARMLQRRLTDPESTMITTNMQANVLRMSALISDVLDFAHGRLGGGIQARLERVNDLPDALVAVVTELRDAHPQRIIECRLDPCRGVRCDRARVQQLVSNLLANALTHGSTSTPVQLSAVIENASLVIEVRNQGERIAPDSLEKIFQPFWRRTTSEKREGLGLGLYICSQIVAAHKGALEVHSDEEHGTRFTARLPLDPSIV